MYQLAARLGTKSHDNRLFQRTLNEVCLAFVPRQQNPHSNMSLVETIKRCFIFFPQLIERAAVDHPHHTLFILLALANAEKDEKYINTGKRNGTSRLARNHSKGTKGFTEVSYLCSFYSILRNALVLVLINGW